MGLKYKLVNEPTGKKMSGMSEKGADLILVNLQSETFNREFNSIKEKVWSNKFLNKVKLLEGENLNEHKTF